MYLSNGYAHIKFTLHKIYGCHTLLPFCISLPFMLSPVGYLPLGNCLFMNKSITFG